MLEMTLSSESDVTMADRARRYRGPERRASQSASRHWMAATLDEIDYGMLLLVDENRVMHVNHAAHGEFDDAHPLQLQGRELRARHLSDVQPLADALHAAARRGLRKLLTLGEGTQRLAVSVVPLPSVVDAQGPVTLVMLGKRRVCEALSAEGYARIHGLTAAETRVLVGLCKGYPPTEIAAELNVAISTVRTQIGTIRLKTGAESIRALVQQVAVLPPLRSSLRGMGGAPMEGLSRLG